MSDPGLEIRGGSHPYPEMRVGGAGSKKFFQPLGSQLRLKIRGSPGPSFWIRHGPNALQILLF